MKNDEWIAEIGPEMPPPNFAAYRLYESRAISADFWHTAKDTLLAQSFEFRNQTKAPTADDRDPEFWSTEGEPAIKNGVVYVRKILPKQQAPLLALLD